EPARRPPSARDAVIVPVETRPSTRDLSAAPAEEDGALPTGGVAPIVGAVDHSIASSPAPLEGDAKRVADQGEQVPIRSAAHRSPDLPLRQDKPAAAARTGASLPHRAETERPSG